MGESEVKKERVKTHSAIDIGLHNPIKSGDNDGRGGIMSAHIPYFQF